MGKAVSKTGLLLVLFVICACAGTGSSTGTGYTKINAAEARALHDRDVLFIDVRTRGSYDDGHIPGAVNLSWLRDYSENQFAAVAEKDQEIVIYCYGIACEVSARATTLAVAWGYTRVYYFLKGFPAWWNAGYPIEK